MGRSGQRSFERFTKDGKAGLYAKRKVRTPLHGVMSWVKPKVRTLNKGKYWAGTQAKRECAASGPREHGLRCTYFRRPLTSASQTCRASGERVLLPSIFKRLNDAINANINDLIDRVDVK